MTNEILAIITGYCACVRCCGPNAAGITASGIRAHALRHEQHDARPGTIAGPRRFPFGSTVVIGTNHYVLEDRLARRFDSRFDIFFSSHADAKRFGIRTNKVTVITP